MKLPTEDDPILKTEDPDYYNSMYSTGVQSQEDFEETNRRFAEYSNIETVIPIGSSAFVFRYRN